jgi:hypothetical protein
MPIGSLGEISTDISSLAVFVTTWMESNAAASRIGCEIPSKIHPSAGAAAHPPLTPPMTGVPKPNSTKI